MLLSLRLPLRLTTAATTALLLAACGGGGESETPANSVGVLTDSPVDGVEYLTSSNLAGLTTGGGRFEYKPGDTIVFKIGVMPLGLVTGSGSRMTVTPLQLIEGTTAITDPTKRENAVTNLLVLLQSLDTDRNPDNGIGIPAAARTALTAPALGELLYQRLTAAPADFAALPEFTDLVADLGNAVVPPAEALAHFREQFLDDLAGSYAGLADNAVVAFRFRGDGAYVMADIDSAAGGGQAGVEFGSIDWNPANGRITASETLDTNGTWGFSDIDPVEGPVQLAVDDGDLVVTRRNGDGDIVSRVRFNRVTNSSTGVAGPWVRGDNRSAMAAQQYLFLPNGFYVLMDAAGDESGEGCGDFGVELGTWRVESGLLVFGTPDFDTNGCDGGYDTVNDLPLIAAAYLNSGLGALQVGPESGGMLLLRPDNSAPD